MALLNEQRTSQAGTDFSFSAASALGDTFPNTGLQGLLVQNNEAAPKTLTFDSRATCSFGVVGNAAHDMVVVVPASTTKFIGLFDPARFNNAQGQVSVTYSDVTTLNVACILP